MKILESKDNTRSIEHSSWLYENIRMDVHHEIPTGSILHHKAHMCLQGK
jgi:hypothetical protein